MEEITFETFLKTQPLKKIRNI